MCCSSMLPLIPFTEMLAGWLWSTSIVVAMVSRQDLLCTSELRDCEARAFKLLISKSVLGHVGGVVIGPARSCVHSS